VQIRKTVTEQKRERSRFRRKLVAVPVLCTSMFLTAPTVVSAAHNFTNPATTLVAVPAPVTEPVPVQPAQTRPVIIPKPEPVGTISPTSSGILPVFSDRIEPGWANWSWATNRTETTNTNTFVAFEPDEWKALQFHGKNLPVTVNTVTFKMVGGPVASQNIRVTIAADNEPVGSSQIGDLEPGPISNEWKTYVFRFPSIRPGSMVDITFQDWSGATQPSVSVDDVSLTETRAPQTTITTTIPVITVTTKSVTVPVTKPVPLITAPLVTAPRTLVTRPVTTQPATQPATETTEQPATIPATKKQRPITNQATPQPAPIPTSSAVTTPTVPAPGTPVMKPVTGTKPKPGRQTTQLTVTTQPVTFPTESGWQMPDGTNRDLKQLLTLQAKALAKNGWSAYAADIEGCTGPNLRAFWERTLQGRTPPLSMTVNIDVTDDEALGTRTWTHPDGWTIEEPLKAVKRADGTWILTGAFC
jgi:hypothetical protein